MAKYVKTEEGYVKPTEIVDIRFDSKMDKDNPVGTGTFSMGRKAGSEVGPSSHAEGIDTTASGYFSHAEGYNTTASGNSSHAEGDSTTASSGSSHAEGSNTTASGGTSHAEGDSTTASGIYSHAEGLSTNKFSTVVTATNPTNDAIITVWKSKKFSLAKGSQSHVEGKDSLALGSSSHVEGYNTTASGEASHAEGSGTTASSKASHAEGFSTTASGGASHAEGNYTTASGGTSHAEGNHTIASSREQHVQGKFNIEDSSDTYADIIGNGTSTSARSNAATLDWNGVPWFQGRPQFGGTAQDQDSQTVMANGDKEIILKSSTPDSTKKFKITVDDTGTISATEIS